MSRSPPLLNLPTDRKSILCSFNQQLTRDFTVRFALQLEGVVFNTGIIPAKIHFTEPTNVFWVEADGTETPIGSMQLHDLSAKNKRATINDTTQFMISDEAAFGRFSSKLITSQNFTWRLVSHNLRVNAAKFPVAKGLTFDKRLTLNGKFSAIPLLACTDVFPGFNSFNGGVVLEELQLPSDNPAGGINFVATNQINNPRLDNSTSVEI